ncbi:hypothetical protein CFD26_104014 [Aspergillus turcosus]|uniref:Cytochrome P450 n=1 Tax=Aspergillus turcosus TaxID=1245748 RepID=A0A421D254_9EURO|nr:hypothetical protein CFD26_104014 [Aspergillus turcosus]
MGLFHAAWEQLSALWDWKNNIVSLLLISTVIYPVALTIYRLYLHPLRSFPGPRLAACTFWYEFYYDVILGGQYTFKIRRLHEQYGPIVRINPQELHVYTPEFYDELYAGAHRRRDKWYWATKVFAADESTFATTKHDLHRSRRAALNPFFSKAQVKRLQSVIQERVDAFLHRLHLFQNSGAVVQLDRAFAAYSADVIMEYAFGKSEHKLNAPDFDSAFHNACVNGGKSSMLMKQFPLILWTMKRVPPSLLLKINPEMTSFVRMHTDIAKQVRETMASSDSAGGPHPTIFQEILSSKLPLHEKALRRLAQDGGAVVGAGTVTTAWAITVAVYHLLSQPATLRKLKNELATTDTTDLTDLERLPYLAACIQEALRLSYGVSSRLARLAPDEALTFTDPDTHRTWTIPPNTPVSMTSLLIFQNPSIFPQPKLFRPERWLDNPRLDRYQVAFCKGSRICLGVNLAYAEMTLMLASLFRRYGSFEVKADEDIGMLELFETTAENDIECSVDGFVPLPKPGSKGVRARVWPVGKKVNWEAL